MSIILTVSLYAYLAFLIIWLVFFVIALYHIIKFGFSDFFGYLLAGIFIGGALLIIGISLSAIVRLDWGVEEPDYESYSMTNIII